MLARFILVTSIMMLGAFISFYYALLFGASEGEARTIAMSAIVMMQIFYIFSARSFSKPAIGKGFFSNKWIFVGVFLTFLFQLCAVYIPMMNSLFKTESIGLIGWLPVLATAGALLTLIELEKIVMKKYEKVKYTYRN